MSIRGVLVCSILLLICSCAFVQDYELRMTRPTKVGREYELITSGSLSEQMTMSAQGEVLRSDKFSLTAKLEGIVTVLQVDELKRERKLRLLVSKSVMSMNGNINEEEALPKGTQVVAQLRDRRKEFLIDGKNVPEEIAKMLDLFISFPTTRVTDDDIFGTKERKKVGDSWAVNSMEAAKDLATEGINVDAENIKGSTTIEKVVVVDGKKCLQLSAKLEISMLAPPLPPGLTVEKSNMSAAFSGTFPFDTSIPRLSEGENMTMEVVAKGKLNPDSPEVTLSIKMMKSVQMKQKALK